MTYKATADPATNKITAFDVDSTIDGGFATDFSWFVQLEVMNHIDSTYNVPNYRHRVQCVTTNTASNTAVRGPGVVQAMSISETIMDHVATELKVDANELRLANLKGTGEGNSLKAVTGQAVASEEEGTLTISPPLYLRVCPQLTLTTPSLQARGPSPAS